MNFFKIILCLIICFQLNNLYGQLDCVKINHLYRKACHNCYDPSVVNNTFYQSLGMTRVVELDIHSHRNTGSEADPGVWYVRHGGVGSNNNDNNCMNANGQSNQDFSICLENVKDWSLDNPDHGPIIVFIDLKPNYATNDFWRPDHATTDLDDVFYQFAMDMGGIDVLYKPSDLRGSFPTLREAAQNENWPSLGNLKNKFIFVLTGDNFFLDEYLTNVGTGAKAFVATNIDAFANSSNGYIPSGISYSNSQEIVFYNLDDTQAGALANFIPANGYMSRSWQSTTTNPGQYYNNTIYNVNNIAIKNVWETNLYPLHMDYQLIDIDNITVGGGNPASPQIISSQYNSILQDAQIKLTVHNLIVQSGIHYNLRAGEEVDLLPSTDIQMGANTDISIGDCASYASNMRINPNIDNEGRVLSQKEMEWMLNSTKAESKSIKNIKQNKSYEKPYLHINTLFCFTIK